ncbi:MAG: N-acetylmuramoyl-L-alanine amidase [bacterium]
MKNFKWLLVAGHGGVKNGKYTSCPNYDPKDKSTWYKMYVHPDGLTVYEGEFNRIIKNLIMDMCKSENIDVIDIVPEDEDINLKERVRRGNEYVNKYGPSNCIWVEIHGNAGKGTGFEIFTTKGQNNSDKVAEIFINEYEKMFPNKVSRVDKSDGDKDKEANFYCIKNVNCPAILTENFFFDRYDDAKLMMSEVGQVKIALSHFNAIKKIENFGY